MTNIILFSCCIWYKNSRFSFNSFNEEIVSNELQYLYQIDFTDKKEKSIEVQLVEALKKAIDSLPARKKEILLKSKIEGRKQKDIAEELGISIKTVEKHLSEAKHELRLKIEAQFSSLSIIIALLLQ